jgi:hypothetical protein
MADLQCQLRIITFKHQLEKVEEGFQFMQLNPVLKVQKFQLTNRMYTNTALLAQDKTFYKCFNFGLFMIMKAGVVFRVESSMGTAKLEYILHEMSFN